MITSTRYIIKHIIRIKLNDITRHNARVKLVTCKKYNFYGMSSLDTVYM